MPGSNFLRRATQRFRRRGAGDLFDRVVMGTVGRAIRPTTRRHSMPPLRDFYTAPGTVAVSADEAFDQIALALAKERPAGLAAEFAATRAELEAAYGRLSSVEFADEREFSLGEASSMVLYGLVRMLRPATILETGVANGHSTFLILKALEHNGAGALHSFDVRSHVGGLLAEAPKDRWHLHVCETLPVRRGFAELVTSLPPIDLFLHDSDHSYANQLCEYRYVRPRLAPGGVLASDDVDKSRAFLDFAGETKAEPLYLVDRWKIFGVMLTPTPATESMEPEPRSQAGS